MQTFFDEIKNGTRNYRTVASLNAQIAQEYRGRCILELLQNAHDALAGSRPDDPRRISFALYISPEPVLLIGNTGVHSIVRISRDCANSLKARRTPTRALETKD